MPRFIDHHPQAQVPPAGQLEQMRARIGSGPDDLGVTALNVHWTAGGQAFCLSEGPDAESVVRSHEAVGVPLQRGRVYEIAESLA